MRTAELNLKSSHVGHPRRPSSFRPLSMPCNFLRHTLGLKSFPCGGVLLHSSSNAGLHSRYLLQPSTNAGPLRSSNARMYPSSNAILYPSSNVVLCPCSNAGLYLRCHRSPWLEKVLRRLSEFNAEKFSMERAIRIRALCRTTSELQRWSASEVS